MKSKENNLEKNISRLVKLAGDPNEPSGAFADSVVKNALDELKGTKAGRERQGGDKFIKAKWKRALPWAAVILVVCGIGSGILISNANKTGETAKSVLKMTRLPEQSSELAVQDKTKPSGVELVVEETSLPTEFTADEAYESLKVSKNLDAFLKQNEPNYNMLLAARAAKPVDMEKPKPIQPKNASTSEESPIAGLLPHGEVKDGLAAFLLCHRARFKVGQPIPLTYGIINIGSRLEWETNLQKAEEHSKLKTRVWWLQNEPADQYNYSWFEVTGPNGQSIPCRASGGTLPNCTAAVVDKFSVVLYHRQFVGKHYPDLRGPLASYPKLLRHDFDLTEPGTYKVRWGYSPWWKVGPWTGTLMSNEVQFEIVK